MKSTKIVAFAVVLSIGGVPVMAHERHIQSWCVNEPAVLSEINAAGYRYLADGDGWIKSDIPIAFNGEFRLPDGKILRSRGTRLTIMTDDQIEQAKIKDFDNQWEKQHGK